MGRANANQLACRYPAETVLVAWTGNFLSNERVSTMLLEGGPREYIHTLAKCKNKLDIERIVPGHGLLGKPEAHHLIAYLWWLLREADEAVRLGLSSAAAIQSGDTG